jgi:ElaB/YqjD/DUF883 family membrane-anchored ribosome-binding protein
LAAARQRVKATLRQVRRKSGDLRLEVAYRARRATTDADHYIHGHPWTTIVIAAGVGALIGYVMGRR